MARDTNIIEAPGLHNRVGVFADLSGRQVIIVDDGLASGATLHAAITAVKKLAPQQLIIALPTGCEHSVEEIAKSCDLLVCANIRSGYPYAVAHAYRQWSDVEEATLLDWLSSTD